MIADREFKCYGWDFAKDRRRCAACEGKGTLLTVRRRLIDLLGQDTVPSRSEQNETPGL